MIIEARKYYPHFFSTDLPELPAAPNTFEIEAERETGKLIG